MGLRNSNVDDFANAICQVIFHRPDFVAAFTPTHGSSPSDIASLRCIAEFFAQMANRDQRPEAGTLATLVGLGAGEQDVHEFLIRLEGLVSSDGALAPFHFRALRDHHGRDGAGIVEEVHADLSLPIAGHDTLAAAIDGYFTTGGGTSDVPTFRLLTFPRILQIQLMRFDSLPPYAKDAKDIAFDEQLVLRGKHFTDESLTVHYRLYAVVVHSGQTRQSGHYYSFVRPNINGQWWRFNDSDVSKTTFNQITHLHQDEGCPYLLFYVTGVR
jgi:hypothetical protein